MPRGGVLTHVVDSGERSLPAGTVTVTATRQVDGVGYTSTYRAGLPRRLLPTLMPGR